jgi:hypothetical protein
MENINLNKALDEVGKLISEKLKVESQKDGFKATGKLESSFTYTSAADELKVFGERYAKALSEGISTSGSGDKEGFKQLQSNIIKWAKIKGIRPLIRDSKGRFKKVNQHSWKSLGYVLARSIRTKGISKRFSYKGSGFMQSAINQTRTKIEELILEGYKKDLQEQLNKK